MQEIKFNTFDGKKMIGTAFLGKERQIINWDI